MQLESRAPGYWLVHNVAPTGLQISLAPWILSLAPPLGDPVIYSIADCEHPLLCWAGPSLLSQETAISGSFHRTLASVCNGVIVWRLIMGWIPGYGSLYMVHPFVSAPNFVSVTPSMGVLFPILRRGIVSTPQSSFFLSFMCLANCILYLGYPRFWVNILLSVSTYCVSSFVSLSDITPYKAFLS